MDLSRLLARRRFAALLLVVLGVGVVSPATAASRGAESAGPRVDAFDLAAATCADGAGRPNQFTDVADDSVFCNDIAWMAETGVTTGRDDGTFGPGDRVLRGQMAAFLHRYAGQPEPPDNAPTFPDVGNDHIFAEAISWLAAEGITTGRDDGRFDPGGNITRGQMAAFLYRYDGRPDLPEDAPTFPDVGSDHVFADAISWLAAEGITTGRDDGRFDPGGTLTRGQMAAFLHRYDGGDGTLDPTPNRTWSRVAHDEAVFGGVGGQWMSGVVAGGPGLVAVGGDGGSAAVWTSGDGTSWQRIAHDEAVFGGDGSQEMSAVAAWGPGVVAVGRDGDRDAAAVWVSEDGTSWQRIAHDEAVFGGPGSQEMSGVAAAGPGIVAVGWSEVDTAASPVAAVWISDDATSWQRIAHDEAVFGGDGIQEMSAVAAWGPGVVAVGRDGDRDAAAVWVSEDGTSWQRIAHDEAVFGGEGSQEMSAVAASDTLLVAAGADLGAGAAAAVWTSSDGRSWGRVAHDEGVFGGQSLLRTSAVTSGGPGFVAVGQGYLPDAAAAVWTSP